MDPQHAEYRLFLELLVLAGTQVKGPIQIASDGQISQSGPQEESLPRAFQRLAASLPHAVNTQFIGTDSSACVGVDPTMRNKVLSPRKISLSPGTLASERVTSLYHVTERGRASGLRSG